MALTILVATALAGAFGGTRIVVAQAAVSAILIVALAVAEAGVDRLADALIGAGVALVFGQILFSPHYPAPDAGAAAAGAPRDMAVPKPPRRKTIKTMIRTQAQIGIDSSSVPSASWVATRCRAPRRRPYTRRLPERRRASPTRAALRVKPRSCETSS